MGGGLDLHYIQYIYCVYNCRIDGLYIRMTNSPLPQKMVMKFKIGNLKCAKS